MDTLGSRIKEARNLERITQRELAEKSGVKIRQIARYEADEATPRGRVLKAIALACHVTCNWLENGGDLELSLNLPISLIERIERLAKINGLTPEEMTIKLLEESFQPDDDK